MPSHLKRIREDTGEEWMDNEVHRYYNMPMVVVRAKPHVLMHCNVCRDTTSLLKTSWTEFFEDECKEKWVQIQGEFKSIADLPERFLHEVPAPPFQIAEVRITANKSPYSWRLRANSGRHLIYTSFWHLWKWVLKADPPTVGPFDIVLRVPSHTPAGEDPFDPWNMSLPNNPLGVISREDVSHLRWDGVCSDSAPLDFTCLSGGVWRDRFPSI